MWQLTKRWLKASGVEFWLPLPFVAIAFWLGSSFLTAQELRQPQITEKKLQADTQLKATLSINIIAIASSQIRLANP